MICPTCLEPTSAEAMAYNAQLGLDDSACVHFGLAENFTLGVGMAVHNRKECVGGYEKQLLLKNTADPVTCITCLARAQ